MSVRAVIRPLVTQSCKSDGVTCVCVEGCCVLLHPRVTPPSPPLCPGNSGKCHSTDNRLWMFMLWHIFPMHVLFMCNNYRSGELYHGARVRSAWSLELWTFACMLVLFSSVYFLFLAFVPRVFSPSVWRFFPTRSFFLRRLGVFSP